MSHFPKLKESARFKPIGDYLNTPCILRYFNNKSSDSRSKCTAKKLVAKIKGCDDIRKANLNKMADEASVTLRDLQMLHQWMIKDMDYVERLVS